MATISIIMPVYNEIKTVRTVIEAVMKAPMDGCTKELVIVDDGSTDGTREILETLRHEGIIVLLNERNSGKGYSVRRGLMAATGDYYAIQDADLEYDPADYGLMLALLRREHLTVVFGRRFGGLNHWQPISRLQFLAHRIIGASSALLSGVRIEDPTSCYKLFTREARDWYCARLCSNTFAIETEIVALTGRGKLKYREMPIHYYPRTYADGKKIRWTDGVRILWSIIKFNW